MAALDVLFCQTRVHHAVECSNVIAQMLEDTADDTVTAAVDFDADLGFVFRVRIGQVIDGCGAVFEGNGAGGNFIEVGFGEGFVEGDVVNLFYLVAWVREFLGEVAVIGEEEDPGGVTVKSAHGEYAFGSGLTNEVEDGAAALRVVGGGDIVFGFV